MKSNTKEIGLAAESLVCAVLEKKGYLFIEKNFSWKGGEIDLVFKESSATIKGLDTLVFVEVRSAKLKSSFLRYSIQLAKQRRLERTIATFLHMRPWFRVFARRFDVVWVEGTFIEHWKNVLILTSGR